MPLYFNDESGPATPQTPFGYQDTRTGVELAERLAQAKQRIEPTQEAPVAHGGAATPAQAPERPASDSALETLPAFVSPQEASANKDSAIAKPSPEPATRPARTQPVSDWTERDEDTWQALKDRLFDEDCTEVSILPNPPEKIRPYTVSVNVNTKNYEDGDFIRVEDEQSLVRIVRERILKHTNMDVPIGGGLPPVAAGTFTYTEKGPDGELETIRARVQILSPPSMYRVGVVFCKLPRTELNLSNLVNNGTLSMDMAHYLNGAVQAGASIVFSGAPGAGKTCLLNACTYQIPQHDKVAVLQDVDELPLEHILIQQKLFTHRAVAQASGAVADGSMSSLIEVVKLSRPDYIITGECRDGAMLDHLEAASIFARGALTTMHAKSVPQALDNVFYFAGKHPDAPRSETRLWEFIAGNLDLIVQLGIVGEQRRVVEISAVSDNVSSHGKPPLTPLWTFSAEAGSWVRQAGPSPETLQARFERAGVRDTHRYPVD